MDIALMILLTSALTLQTESARILAVLPTRSQSHHRILNPVLGVLAQAGHEVVVFSSHQLKDPPPTYRHIPLTDEATFNRTEIPMNLMSWSPWNCLTSVLDFHESYINRTLQNENVKKLLRSNEKFDLVITEPFMAQEFTFIFGYKFKAPTIGIQTFATTCYVNEHFGNDLFIASSPPACFSHSEELTFWQRLLNLFFIVRSLYVYNFHYFPMLEKKMKAYFPEMPPLQELSNNMSLVFVNDHLTADYAFPRPQTIVPIAGIHIEDEKPLPQDIKKFMDEAENGVILFSLGSIVLDETKPQGYFENVANAFRNLRQRVIWKTGKDDVAVPDNVLVVKWMPQRDILAHPNCVLFVTHGGAASQYEAIYNAVPVIGIPHFSDQYRTVDFFVARGVGVKLMPDAISEESLTLAIKTVVENQKYSDNMRRLSHIFKDTEMSPKQSVLYWTEYVLRHRGAPHLKSAQAKLKWYQKYLIDIIALIVFLIFTACIMFYVTVKTICLYFNTKYNTNSVIIGKKIH